MLLDLTGGVALLLWGMHMVHSGILRAFGADLRRFLGAALGNRFSAFGVGVTVTTVLQSSTATGLLVTSFAASGMLALVPALAVMLGANLGTTLVAQVLSFDISPAAPVLLILGVVAFRRGARTRTRDLGRVAIGLGLMLLALHILLGSLAPAENAPAVRSLLQAVTREPVLNLLIGALLAWAAHSSLAVVVMVMSLAYSNFLTPVAALALVLGANLGSAINPLLEGGTGANPATRRLPFGNLAIRVIGCLLVLPFLTPIAGLLQGLELEPAAAGGGFPQPVQSRARGAVPAGARRRRLGARATAAGAAWRRPIPAVRFISIRSRSTRRRWRSPAPRARCCISATSSRRCCVRP